MKLMTKLVPLLSLTLVASAAAQELANPRFIPTPSTNVAPNEAKGRINRLASTVASQAERAAEEAKRIFGANFYDNRISDQEVAAVAALVFVKDTAQDFRSAVATENFRYAKPVRSELAYRWLNRAFAGMETNHLLRSTPQLRDNFAQIERTMRELRAFFALAERLGWDLADVVLVAQKLDRETDDVIRLVMNELDSRGELILREIEEFQAEVKRFNNEARRYGTPGNARQLLSDNFRQLRHRYTRISNLMSNPRFARFSPAVQRAFGEVRIAFTDLEDAFIETN